VSKENNKAVVRQYVDAFNRGDWDALTALFADDALIYGVLGWGAIEVVMPIWKQLHEGLNMTLEVVDMVAEGDTVAVRYTERGTAVGSFMGNAPTGKSYEVVAMEWFIVRDGKIERRWGARDAATIYKQLGF
jgi:steroid delta-isomerase-like uncharacterized protein